MSPKIILYNGNCLNKLNSMPENSIDSIVTDPPYGIRFMGKEWDYDVPSTEIWRECLRVLKPGGYILSFSSARTYHRIASNIEEVGFEIRDQIMWIYGTGFPKSQNIMKSMDKYLGVSTNTWKGWGTALKPSHEPIIVARKPLSEKTIVKNILKWGTGGINIDKCRIPLQPGENLSIVRGDQKKLDAHKMGWGFKSVSRGNEDRFPSNVIFEEEPDEIWSKYFYCAKPTTKEKNLGIPDGIKNIHPTVKPIKLMKYLINLVTPVGGTTMDPFMGSGVSGLVCAMNNFNFVGCELDEEYFEISSSRIKNNLKQAA